MENLFEGIIALIVIFASLAKFVGQTKKVKQNAPGKAAAPVCPAAPAAPAARPAEPARPAPAVPTVKPTVQPSGGSVQLPEFWQQVSRALKEELAPEKKTDPGHETVGKMAEGDSRECGHGSIGGSMAYEAHDEGGRMTPNVRTPATSGVRAQQNEPAYRPAMNAQEMRRAVVMAEILKRPQDRMAEQARRWNVR